MIFTRSILYKMSSVFVACLITWSATSTAMRYFRTSPLPMIEMMPHRVEVDFRTLPKKPTTVEAKIVNRGTKLIEIENITTSCTCTQSRDYKGLSIQPHSEATISFVVEPPSFGTTNVSASVKLVSVKEPLLLDFSLHSPPASVPVLLSKLNGDPIFFDLADVSDTTITKLITRESGDSPAWLGEFQSSLPEIKITLQSVEVITTLSDNIVERQYNVIIGWKALPLAQNFNGQYFALSSGTHSPVKLGSICGSKKRSN
jgi:hypothetical protein